MKGCMRRCAVGVAAWLGLAGLAILSAISQTGCAHPAAFNSVADQNATNVQVYATNVGLLCNAARELASVQAGAMLQRARERVSADLVRIRAGITPMLEASLEALLQETRTAGQILHHQREALEQAPTGRNNT